MTTRQAGIAIAAFGKTILICYESREYPRVFAVFANSAENRGIPGIIPAPCLTPGAGATLVIRD